MNNQDYVDDMPDRLSKRMRKLSFKIASEIKEESRKFNVHPGMTLDYLLGEIEEALDLPEDIVDGREE